MSTINSSRLNGKVNDDAILLPPVQREVEAPTSRNPRRKGSLQGSGEQGNDRRHRRSVVRRTVLVVAGIVVLSLVWVGVRGGMAANAVVAGASSAAKLGPLMYSGDVSGARDEVEAIQASAASGALADERSDLARLSSWSPDSAVTSALPAGALRHWTSWRATPWSGSSIWIWPVRWT